MIFVDRTSVTIPQNLLHQADSLTKRIIDRRSKLEPQQRLDMSPAFKIYLKFKPFLRKLFANKCCYCEQSLGVDGGVIEHFRPKSKYPELAARWPNLYLACNACNANKANKDPFETDGDFEKGIF